MVTAGVMEQLESRQLAQLLWAAAKHATWRSGGLKQGATSSSTGSNSNNVQAQQHSSQPQGSSPLVPAQQSFAQPSLGGTDMVPEQVHVGGVVLSFDEEPHSPAPTQLPVMQTAGSSPTASSAMHQATTPSVPKVFGAPLLLMQAAQSRLLAVASTMSSPEACMISWAYAASHVPARPLLQAIADHLLGLDQGGGLQLDAPSVATLLWSYARQGHVHEVSFCKASCCSSHLRSYRHPKCKCGRFSITILP
jgi:hypothetical protein